MKSYLIILVIALFSCTQSPVEKLICDYEQKIDGTTTDLSLKIKELKEVGFITALDSAKIYEEKFNIESIKMIEVTSAYINTLEVEISEYKRAIKDPILNVMHSDYKKRLIELQKKHIETNATLVQYKNGDFSGTIYKELENKAVEFKKLGAEKLVLVYECTYSIKNPFLNGVSQTLHKSYHITSDLTKIIIARKKT